MEVSDFNTIVGCPWPDCWQERGNAEARAAIEAAKRYGRAVGSPSDLNFGDCLAYACAEEHGAALLYKGNDFAQTDLA